MENLNPENVNVDDLLKTPFPTVSKNVVAAFSENGGEASKPAENADLAGYNPEIHESPPRKNKNGEWAKKRGNKKGFVFGKSKTENAPEPKTPLNLPPENPTPENVSENGDGNAAALEISTEQAAKVASSMFYFGLQKFSDYDAPQKERQAHETACFEYLMSRGGVDMPPWGVLAAVSAQSIMNACSQPKAKTRFQKIKEWIVLKIYAWKTKKEKTDGISENAYA